MQAELVPNAHDFVVRRVGIVGDRRLPLIVKRGEPDARWGRVEGHKFSFLRKPVSHEDSAFKVLSLRVPTKLGTFSHHFWQHVICPTVLSVKGPASLAGAYLRGKQNVLFLFHTAQELKPAKFAALSFHTCNDIMVNLGLKCKLRFCFESTFLQVTCKKIHILGRIGKSKLSSLKSRSIHRRDLYHAGAF